MAPTATPRARPRGLVFFVLFVGSFAATLVLTRQPPPQAGNRGAGATPALRNASTDSLGTRESAPDQPAADAASATKTASAPAMPADQIRQLVDAALNAEDSEQRSLAIEGLRNASVDQALPALVQVVREDRDARSRLTAIAELARLPDTEAVRQVRPALLKALASDPDYRIAAAAHSAANGDG